MILFFITVFKGGISSCLKFVGLKDFTSSVLSNFGVLM